MTNTPNRPWSTIFDDELKLMRRIVGLAAGARLAHAVGSDSSAIDELLDSALHEYIELVGKGPVQLFRAEVYGDGN